MIFRGFLATFSRCPGTCKEGRTDLLMEVGEAAFSNKAATQGEFRRSLGSLENIFAWSREFTQTHEISATIAFQLDVIIEELFTNTVKYNPGGPDAVRLSLAREGDKIILMVVDFNPDPFDITARPDVRTDAPLAERRSGGLGLHFVKMMSDSIDFRHAEGQSTITVTKLIR